MMYKFKIDKIIVNTADGTEEIVPKKVNIIVGPNNSGKSRFLKEIRDYLSGDNRDIKIINSIENPLPKSFSELDNVYDVSSKMVKDQYGNWMLKSYSNKPTQVLDMTASLESYFTIQSVGIGLNILRELLNEKIKLSFLIGMVLCFINI